MLQAAIAGLGIALGRSLLVEDDIRSGLLVPVGQPVRVAAAYWLVTKPEPANTDGMNGLRNWLARPNGLRSAPRATLVRAAGR
jgi:LysR family transcriptional regulator, glycine cleavage system transcriptional activator